MERKRATSGFHTQLMEYILYPVVNINDESLGQ